MSLQEQEYSGWAPVNLTAAGTYVLKPGPGTLHAVIFNTIGFTAVHLYDSTGAATSPIANFGTSPAAGVAILYDADFVRGLTVVTTGTGDITVEYA